MEQTTSIEKALEVLFHLHDQPSGCGVTAVGAALGMPKSSTHRLLAALGRRGLVERDESGLYRPGMALVALGVGVLEREPVVAAARPILEAEAERQGETLFLTAARSGRILVLDKAEGTGFLRAVPRVGSELPVHATAVGKLYMAVGADQVARPRSPQKFTARTTTRSADIDAELRTVARRGWAENREEWQPGLAVVAGPVFLGERLVAAVALAAPAARLVEADTPAAGERIAEVAAIVSARLAGSLT